MRDASADVVASAVARLLDSEDPTQRYWALLAASERPHQGYQEKLEKLQSEDESGIRGAAVLALVSLGASSLEAARSDWAEGMSAVRPDGTGALILDQVLEDPNEADQEDSG